MQHSEVELKALKSFASKSFKFWFMSNTFIIVKSIKLGLVIFSVKIIQIDKNNIFVLYDYI